MFVSLFQITKAIKHVNSKLFGHYFSKTIVFTSRSAFCWFDPFFFFWETFPVDPPVHKSGPQPLKRSGYTVFAWNTPQIELLTVCSVCPHWYECDKWMAIITALYRLSKHRRQRDSLWFLWFALFFSWLVIFPLVSPGYGDFQDRHVSFLLLFYRRQARYWS